MNASQRLMRAVTTAVVRAPVLWRPLRKVVSSNFDRIAEQWDANRVNESTTRPIDAAFATVDEPPKRVLDLGTGSGAVARSAGERWPQAEVVGVDVSPRMVAEAQRLATSERQSYEVADAARLPFDDGAFDVVAQNNMIPFFDELVRVLAPGGTLAIAYSRGPQTPIYVPLARVRRELERRGLSDIQELAAGAGVALVARLHSPAAGRGSSVGRAHG